MPHHRLTGHMIATTTADTKLMCAYQCLRNEQCKSCNFKTIRQNVGICELNSQPSPSESPEPALIQDANFLFISLENVSFTPAITVRRYFSH